MAEFKGHCYRSQQVFLDTGQRKSSPLITHIKENQAWVSPELSHPSAHLFSLTVVAFGVSENEPMRGHSRGHLQQVLRKQGQLSVQVHKPKSSIPRNPMLHPVCTHHLAWKSQRKPLGSLEKVSLSAYHLLNVLEYICLIGSVVFIVPTFQIIRKIDTATFKRAFNLVSKQEKISQEPKEMSKSTALAELGFSRALFLQELRWGMKEHHRTETLSFRFILAEMKVKCN